MAVLVIFMLIYSDMLSNLTDTQDEFKARFTEPVLAIHDRHQEVSNHERVNIRHYAIIWGNTNKQTPSKDLAFALAEQQDLLLSIELWAGVAKSGSYSNVLEDLLKGAYNQKIEELCTALAKRQQPTYLRWNPEMEVPVHHFPWQNQSPDLYIKAFRHFAGLCKRFAPGVKIVWGPAGFPGALEYWPGSDVVDMASISLHSKSEDLTSAYSQDSSTTNLIKRKLHRLRFIDKPVILLGSENLQKEDYRHSMLVEAVASIKDYYEIPTEANADREQEGKTTADLLKVADKKGGDHASLVLGVYDPKQELTAYGSVAAEHLFTSLESIKNGFFRERFNEVLARRHDVIVTIEPWNFTNKEGGSNVLHNTINGEYDSVISELYRIVSNTGRTVYLRWAHEMEIPITRYPWQSQDPVLYIKAFRHFVDQGKPLANNIRIVWGPAGDRGSLEWWPGEDYVDYISMAIYGLPDKNITDHHKQESFSRIFKRKRHRMRFANKPIFITEFGVKGPEEYQKAWLKGAAETINEYPDVVGICYFNLHDTPQAWGEIEAPDWSISSTTFQQFTRSLAGVE